MPLTEQYNKELYHYGVKGMKWGVRRYQNEDGSLTNAGKKRNHKVVAKYADAENKARTMAARMKAQDKLEESFRKYAKSCKESTDKHRDALDRMIDYEEPYLDELGRLEYKYRSKRGSIDIEDNIPVKDWEVIKRQAAKKVGYDEKVYKRLRADYEKARDDNKRDCKKVADSLLGEYGDTPMLNIGYANERTARDIVSDVLYRSNWGFSVL